jgi:hypothetical protein
VFLGGCWIEEFSLIGISFTVIPGNTLDVVGIDQLLLFISFGCDPIGQCAAILLILHLLALSKFHPSAIIQFISYRFGHEFRIILTDILVLFLPTFFLLPSHVHE